MATELGIVLCLHWQPADGGIVERPFGTFNREFFNTLPEYVSSNVIERSPQAETDACLTLLQLERLLVRYVVDNYNQRIDARKGNQKIGHSISPNSVKKLQKWRQCILPPADVIDFKISRIKNACN
ncbi:hypothetical protein [Leptolyngbya sp. GGD]|uniref:hypothetical protein n=1 Tax=Leptolyngbya sp. GGD TaxID=2997907 RepID=UPI00227B9770|nr:hypothetical protein [Leptolyngbya sp. GGD]MCY6494319.1 hypothetical protein [Leptolyngbya sp. GGD]